MVICRIRQFRARGTQNSNQMGAAFHVPLGMEWDEACAIAWHEWRLGLAWQATANIPPVFGNPGNRWDGDL